MMMQIPKISNKKYKKKEKIIIEKIPKSIIKRDHYNHIIDVDEFEIYNINPIINVATISATCKINRKINFDNIKLHYQTLIDEYNVVCIKFNTDNYATIDENIIKRKKFKKEIKDDFKNQATVIIRINDGPYKNKLTDEPLVNIKLFNNGSIQLTGSKSIYGINIVLIKLIEWLNKIYKINNIEYKLINDSAEKIQITNFKINMIYCNFKLNFCIDRDKLYALLRKKKYICFFEPDIRAGVKIQINSITLPDKNISIFIFQKGNVIITGARSRHDINHAWDFIFNIVDNHKENIIINPLDYDKLITECSNEIFEEIALGIIKRK